MQGWIDLIAKLIAYFILLGIPCILIIKCKQAFDKRGKHKHTEYIQECHIESTNINQSSKTIEYRKSYEPKYLMSINEKTQFRIILHWAQSRGLLVFTKVRLLDLITPRYGQDNRQGLLWKIQAKHVDFVICDTDINVKCIIEINDSSHKQKDRIERDSFVNEVLEACGYKILWTYNVTNEQLDQICGYNISTVEEQNQP